MNVEGSYEIDAPVEKVWDLLVDPEVLAELIPGARSLELVGENSYRATMDVGLGPVRPFTGLDRKKRPLARAQTRSSRRSRLPSGSYARLAKSRVWRSSPSGR